MPLTKPPIDLAGWYENSHPGPMHGCTTGSFPGGFDNDTVMNHSRGTVNLDPSSAYDCQVLRRAGQPGRPHRLEPDDQGAHHPRHDLLRRQHRVLELVAGRTTPAARRSTPSGTITLRNSTQVCGIPTCDEAWDPLQNLLAFVAGSSTDATGFSVENFSTFQGGVYVVNDYIEQNNSSLGPDHRAPALPAELDAVNHYVPLGVLLPGMPQTWEEAVSLVNETGGLELLAAQPRRSPPRPIEAGDGARGRSLSPSLPGSRSGAS